MKVRLVEGGVVLPLQIVRGFVVVPRFKRGRLRDAEAACTCTDRPTYLTGSNPNTDDDDRDDPLSAADAAAAAAGAGAKVGAESIKPWYAEAGADGGLGSGTYVHTCISPNRPTGP